MYKLQSVFSWLKECFDTIKSLTQDILLQIHHVLSKSLDSVKKKHY